MRSVVAASAAAVLLASAAAKPVNFVILFVDVRPARTQPAGATHLAPLSLTTTPG